MTRSAVITRILRVLTWIFLAWGCLRLGPLALWIVQISSNAASDYEYYAFTNRAFGEYWWAYWGVVLWPLLVAAALTLIRLVIESDHKQPSS